MTMQEQYERGLALRTSLFGEEAVQRRMAAFGDFGAPLQRVINAYVYGDVWSRPGDMATRSLVMIGMMAAAGKPNELGVHLRGAVANGCSPEQIQDVLLLVAMHCGVPAAIEAHRVAVEVLREAGKLP